MSYQPGNFNQAEKNRIALAKLTPEQRERYEAIVEQEREDTNKAVANAVLWTVGIIVFVIVLAASCNNY